LHAGPDLPVDRRNAVHSIEQRTAKWIISTMERTNREDVVLTHEQLATMLGVGRSYASRVIQTFKAEGVLETRRGSILVRNREALRIRACLCNECVKTTSKKCYAPCIPPKRPTARFEVGATPPIGG
jgi:DNA-binding transcriptional regulator YhcF (GntR family)